MPTSQQQEETTRNLQIANHVNLNSTLIKVVSRESGEDVVYELENAFTHLNGTNFTTVSSANEVSTRESGVQAHVRVHAVLTSRLLGVLWGLRGGDQEPRPRAAACVPPVCQRGETESRGRLGLAVWLTGPGPHRSLVRCMTRERPLAPHPFPQTVTRVLNSVIFMNGTLNGNSTIRVSILANATVRGMRCGG